MSDYAATNTNMTILLDGATSSFQEVPYCTFCKQQHETLEEAGVCCRKKKSIAERAVKALVVKRNGLMRQIVKIERELDRYEYMGFAFKYQDEK